MTSFCPFQKLFPVFKASAFSASGIFRCADAGFGAEQIYECTHIEVYKKGSIPHTDWLVGMAQYRIYK